MDRRDFIRNGFRKVTKTVVEEIDSRVEKRARRYIRPPYAIKEVEFLLACSRCSDCVDACPHDVLFKLSAKLGADVVGTPAMALLSKGCHLCEDWPCVNACTTGALAFPESGDEQPDENDTQQPELPRLARMTIDENTCLPFSGPECGACVPVCPVPGALILNQEKPYIVPLLCTGCALCREACILEEKAIHVSSL